MIKNLRELIKKIRKAGVSKRTQLVLVTVILSFGLMATQLVSFEDREKMILGLSLLTLILSVWAFRENLKGIKWLILLILPPLFSAAVGLFYFLLPVRWLTRLPFIILFALGMYALLLTENIYNVATERTIGLLKVAQSVGLLVTLIICFLLIETILSFHLAAFLNFIFTFVFCFLLTLPSLWSVRLGETIKKEIIYGGLISLCLGELALIFSFWPVKITMEALFLTTVFYVLVGGTQQYLQGRLFKKAVNEFLTVFLIVFFLLLLTTTW